MTDYAKYSDEDLKRHQKDIRQELKRRKEEERKKELADRTTYF